MKRFTIAITSLIFGFVFSGLNSYAGVVAHPEKKENDYQMHLRIVVQNFAARIQKPKQSQLNLFQNNASLSLKTDSSIQKERMPLVGNEGFTKFSINPNGLQDIYSSSILSHNNLVLSKEQQGDFVDGSVGSFLDSFTDDPSLRTIYFTSKDLSFSYQKSIANLLQDSFELDQERPNGINRAWTDKHAEDRPLTTHEQQAIKQETGLIFGLISESFKTIFMVLISMIGALYLCFRYILNKYI